jgi:GntR family transcriptional regulator
MGVLKAGDLVPSESELCSKYGISRTTVRQALNQLAEERLIIRRRGKGTFIASEKIHRSLNHMYSFSEDMLSMGLTPSSKIFESTIVEASEEIKELLRLTENNCMVFKLTRLRIANDEPLLLENTYIPIYLCPDIVDVDFSSISLYSLLRTKYKLELYRAVETYESVKLNKDSSKLLNCRPSSTAFKIQRIAYLDTDIPFELTYSTARSDKCIFKVELHSNKNKVNFSRKMFL